MALTLGSLCGRYYPLRNGQKTQAGHLTMPSPKVPFEAHATMASAVCSFPSWAGNFIGGGTGPRTVTGRISGRMDDWGGRDRPRQGLESRQLATRGVPNGPLGPCQQRTHA